MVDKKSKFKETLDKYYANGLFKQVYASDNAIVCNILNQLYVGFSLDVVGHYDQNYPGFIMNSNGLRNVIQDPNFINTYFGNLSSKGQDDALLILEDRFFNHMMANKDALSRKPPNPELDLAYEQQVIASQSKQGELASMLGEAQAQSLAAAQQKGVPSQK